MFELEERYQQYERLVLSAECLRQSTPSMALNDNDVDILRRLSARLRATLLRRREASLGELLDVRDEVLTVGSGAAVGVMRHFMNVRPRLESDGLAVIITTCFS